METNWFLWAAGISLMLVVLIGWKYSSHRKVEHLSKRVQQHSDALHALHAKVKQMEADSVTNDGLALAFTQLKADIEKLFTRIVERNGGI